MLAKVAPNGFNTVNRTQNPFLSFMFSILLPRECKLSIIHRFYTTIFTNCFTRILAFKEMYSNLSTKHQHLSKIIAFEIEKKSKHFLMELQIL